LAKLSEKNVPGFLKREFWSLAPEQWFPKCGSRSKHGSQTVKNGSCRGDVNLGCIFSPSPLLVFVYLWQGYPNYEAISTGPRSHFVDDGKTIY